MIITVFVQDTPLPALIMLDTPQAKNSVASSPPPFLTYIIPPALYSAYLSQLLPSPGKVKVAMYSSDNVVPPRLSLKSTS